jgi:anti-sigma regulatory factor (Ser/Thr protein kinase)
VELRLETAQVQATDVRRDIVAFLKREASADSDFHAAELIVGELLANVVKHAPGSFEIGVFWEHGYAVFEISDGGQRFSYPRPPPEPSQGSGHGLRLAAALARELIVRRVNDHGNLVRAVLPVTRS